MENCGCGRTLDVSNFGAVQGHDGGSQDRASARASVVGPVDVGVGSTDSAWAAVEPIYADNIGLPVGHARNV